MQNALAGKFGCSFTGAAKKPLKAAADLSSGEIEGSGDCLALEKPNQWCVLVADARDRPVLASRNVGKGMLLVGARGLAGRNPDASDDINALWWQPLLAEVASGKTVDSGKPFRSRGIGELELRRTN